MSEAQLRDLPRYQASAAFAPLEKLVLDYAVAMTNTPVEEGGGGHGSCSPFIRLRCQEARIIE